MTRSITGCAQPCVCHPPEYSPAYFSCREYHQNDNKQAYNHAIKLPDARFRQIRLSGVFELSGSVPRPRNNHTALFRWCAAGRGEGDKHYI